MERDIEWRGKDHKRRNLCYLDVQIRNEVGPFYYQ